jgi:hypothetical protein
MRGALAAAVSVATVATVAHSAGAALAVVAAAVLAFSLAPFFLRTHFRLDAQGVRVTRLGRTTRKPWNAFRAVRAGDALCLLSPNEKRSWLDSYRGCALLLDGNRAEVVRYAEAMVGTQHARASGASG